MKRSAAVLSAVWCVLSLMCVMVVFHLTMDASEKMSQFIMVNTLFIAGLGLFFIICRDKVSLLLSNYQREKEI